MAVRIRGLLRGKLANTRYIRGLPNETATNDPRPASIDSREYCAVGKNLKNMQYF